MPNWFYDMYLPSLNLPNLTVHTQKVTWGIITSMDNAISYYSTISIAISYSNNLLNAFLVHLFSTILMLSSIALNGVNIFKRNLHLPLISISLYLASYIPITIYYFNALFVNIYPFIGFFVGIILFVVIFILDLKNIVNSVISIKTKISNYQPKPTKNQRIAQLEKELQELKNKSN